MRQALARHDLQIVSRLMHGVDAGRPGGAAPRPVPWHGQLLSLDVSRLT